MNFFNSIKSMILGSPVEPIDYLSVGEMQKALKLMNEGKFDEAYQIFCNEVEIRPENGYAHYNIGYLLVYNGKYGESFSANNEAIKHLQGDKVWQAAAFFNRARAFYYLKDYKKMLEDIDTSLKLNSDEADVYNFRAKYYYDQKDDNSAMKDLKRMMELDPGDPSIYTNMANCEIRLHNLDEAKRLCEYAIKLNDEYGGGYFTLGLVQVDLKEYESAVENMVKGIDYADDKVDKGNYLILGLPIECDEFVESKLYNICRYKSNDGVWARLLGHFYFHRNQYSKAVDYYEEAFKRDGYACDIFNKAKSLYFDQHPAKALKTIDRAIEMVPDDKDYIDLRIRIMFDLETFDECSTVCSNAIKRFPDNDTFYIRYAECLRYLGNLEKSLDMINKALRIEHNNPYAQYVLGKIYYSMGRIEDAAKAFKCSLADDAYDVFDELACMAYVYLNRLDKAFAELEKDHNEDWRYYITKAWCHAAAGHAKDALDALQQACDLGFSRFFELTNRWMPDSLRKIDGFDELIEKAKSKHKAMLDEEYIKDNIEITYRDEVPFTKELGEICVRGEVNGLPLRFVFDTGATVVSISKVEAAFMLKNGYLEERDLGGVRNYRLANGDFVEGTVVNLREVKLGKVVFHDVRASIQNNQDAPILMGLTMVGRMQSFVVNNEKKTISFKTTVEI